MVWDSLDFANLHWIGSATPTSLMQRTNEELAFACVPGPVVDSGEAGRDTICLYRNYTLASEMCFLQDLFHSSTLGIGRRR